MHEKIPPAWIQAVEKLGFDVSRRDPLFAHKEYGELRAIDLSLDASGQVRMTVTSKTAETKSEHRKSQSGREYHVFVEENRVSIINYRLHPQDEIAQVLAEMEKEIA
jgi:hypothetical protein